MCLNIENIEIYIHTHAEGGGREIAVILLKLLDRNDMGIFGGLSAGRRARGQGRTGEKVQGIRSRTGRYKIDRGVLRII